MPQVRMLIYMAARYPYSMGKEPPGGLNGICVLPGHRPVFQRSNSQVRVRLARSWPLDLGNHLHLQASRGSVWKLDTIF